MKKLYALFLFVAALGVNVSFAGNSCVIDQNNTQFFTPEYDNVPCAEIGVQYNQTLQFYIPTSVNLQDFGVPFSYVLTCDSVVLDSVGGLPAGLNWSANPAGPLYLPGTNGCGLTFGTTNVAAGNYPIVFYGLIYLRGNAIPNFFDGDTALTIQQFIQANQGGTYSIDVIAQGGTCGGTGIRDFSADLNAMLSVFPNPNNGVFGLKLNAGGRVNGELVIVDVTGKKVYGQTLDVMGLYNTTIDLANMPKGLYTLQLRTAEGFASKNISVE